MYGTTGGQSPPGGGSEAIQTRGKSHPVSNRWRIRIVFRILGCISELMKNQWTVFWSWYGCVARRLHCIRKWVCDVFPTQNYQKKSFFSNSAL